MEARSCLLHLFFHKLFLTVFFFSFFFCFYEEHPAPRSARWWVLPAFIICKYAFVLGVGCWVLVLGVGCWCWVLVLVLVLGAAS